jgi:hypothetical protein
MLTSASLSDEKSNIMYVVGYYMKDVAIPSTPINLDILTRECASTAVNLIRHRVVQRPIFEPEVAKKLNNVRHT